MVEIVPVPGCEACDRALRESRGERTIYKYRFHDCKLTLVWDVRTARRIACIRLADWARSVESGGADLRCNPPPLEVMPRQFLEDWISANPVDIEHAAEHIGGPTIEWPALAFLFTRESIPPKYTGFFDHVHPFPQATVLIDGVHRAYRALQDGQPLWVYPLTPQEQQLCLAGARVD